MGLFSLFVKPRPATTDNKVPGPTFLEGITTHIENPRHLRSHEWRRRLCTPEGSEWFRIWYYGHQVDGRNPLVVATEAAPVLMYAEDLETGRRILLFDGAKHGYKAISKPSGEKNEFPGRAPTHPFADDYGNTAFRVTLSAMYGIAAQKDPVFGTGSLDRINGAAGSLAQSYSLQRDGFDTFYIYLTNTYGENILVLSEELV